ncbi:MAG: UDP-N-acetylmuramyl-tripeptide synthetase [bacterium]|nr:UDP-N-acetylmuramyl-tripeptide synthetase [bacterium]
MRSFFRKIIPVGLRRTYGSVCHFIVAVCGAAFYGFPSEKLIVIGITGTKGKTSTANFIWSALQNGGIKTGILTTANIRIGEKELRNDYHMTMLGRSEIQKYLRQMVSERCKVAVVETTSEGIKQFRHKGINYDFLVFTNLSPEHLPSHGGSFEMYKQAKGKIFSSLHKHRHKIIDGRKVDKVIMVNSDDDEKNYFLSFKADKKITFGLKEGASVLAENIKAEGFSVSFKVDGSNFDLRLPGVFNVYNALPAVAIGRFLGVSDEKIANGFKELATIPGRMEVVQKEPFTAIVDYAHEGRSMEAALLTAKLLSGSHKVIVVLGAEGGGRYKGKRPVMGRVAAERADFIIVSNVDAYEDDPREIAEDIAKSAESAGAKREETLYVVLDRRLGIRKALSLATGGDVVIVTGKGAEQTITINGKTLPWDDRVVVREELNRLKNQP